MGGWEVNFDRYVILHPPTILCEDTFKIKRSINQNKRVVLILGHNSRVSILSADETLMWLICSLHSLVNALQGYLNCAGKPQV